MFQIKILLKNPSKTDSYIYIYMRDSLEIVNI